MTSVVRRPPQAAQPPPADPDEPSPDHRAVPRSGRDHALPAGAGSGGAGSGGAGSGGAGDPVDDLVRRIRPAVACAVDALQVAARLEADGITDRAARVEYGYADVFELAEDVFGRLAPGPPAPADDAGAAVAVPAAAVPVAAAAVPAVDVAVPAASGRRDIAHGLLYLMPVALFPAVLAAVGPGPLVTAMVLTGGLGWAWSGGASWLAYRRLGAGDPGGAAAVLRWSVLLGLPAASTLGVAVTVLGRGGPALVVLCTGQMAFQLASMLLVFYRREELLAAAMAPAVAAGGGYVAAGLVSPRQGPASGPGYVGWDWWSAWSLPVTLGLGMAAVLGALALGLREAAGAAGDGRASAGRASAGRASAGLPTGRRAGLRAGLRATSPVARRAGLRARWRAGPTSGLRTSGLRTMSRADLRGLAWATAYAALSAFYLLQAQAPYLRGRLDIALAAAPLLAGMGVVEWRARRFGEQARALLGRVHYPRQFAARLRLLLAGGVAASTGAVALLALPLLAGLHRAGSLGRAGILMTAAHAALAGAYFLGFLLAGQGRYAPLCAALVAAVALHTAGGSLVGAGVDPLADTGLFLGSAVLLQGMWAALLARAAAQAWRYR